MSTKGAGYLKLEGFDELINKITEAGGKIDEAVTQCVKKSADVLKAELEKKMSKAKVDDGLISRMSEPKIFKTLHSIGGKVGYIPTQYHPKNVDDFYKVIFINYGTPRIKPRNFIKSAKRTGARKVKKLQEETLQEILEGLKK